MTENGDFAIFDLATDRDIDLSENWETVFRPGQAVAMCMIFRRDENRDNLCPSCKGDCPGSIFRGTQWYAIDLPIYSSVQILKPSLATWLLIITC
jgi:hypothetical protein